MGRPAQLVLVTLAALAPRSGLCVREGGSPDSHFLGINSSEEVGTLGVLIQHRYGMQLGESWTPPGMDAVANWFHKKGDMKTYNLVKDNPIKVFAGGVAIAMVLLITFVGFAYCCCCRKGRRQTPSGEAGAGDEAGGSGSTTAARLAAAAAAAEESEEGKEMVGEISKLKKEKTKILFEQAMQKAKLERLMNQILQLEAELENRKHPPLTAEEAQKQVEDAMRATEMITERSLVSVMAYLGPMAYQSGKIAEVMEKRRLAVQAQAAKVAMDEAKEFCKELGEVFAVDEETRTGMFGTMSGMEIPSIVTIVQSAFAPAKLNISAVFLKLGVATNLIFAFIDLVVGVVDRKVQCRKTHDTNVTDDIVYYWFSIDLAITGICGLIRLWSLWRISRVVEEIEVPPVAPDKPVAAFRILLDYYMTVGADALSKYDEFQRSYLNLIANWIFFFSVGWMMYAVWVVFNTPWATCMAAGVIILRVRVCVFLIFLVPTLLNILGFFVTSYLDSEAFKMTLITVADYMDTLFGLGVPVVGLAVQVCIVRTPRDMTCLSLRRAEIRKYQLGLEQNEMEQKLKEVEAMKSSIESQIQSLAQKRDDEDQMTDDEIRQKHLEAKDAIIKEAESFFVKFSGKAEDLSKHAEETMRKWEEEGAINPQDLLDAGIGRDQVAEYLSAARRQASDQLGRVVGGDRLQTALEQATKTAQSAADVARERAKDLPSLDEAVERAKETGSAAMDKAKETGSAAMEAVSAEAPPPAAAPAAMGAARSSADQPATQPEVRPPEAASKAPPE